MERTNYMKIHSEKSRKKLLQPDNSMINNSYNDELKKHTIPNHSMITSINNDIPTLKRTPEDRAKSLSYFNDSDQTWKV